MSITKTKTFLFILGAPRSGTTWIQRLISSHPNAISVDFETTLFYKYIKPTMERYQSEMKINSLGIKHGLPAQYSENEFKSNLTQIIDKYYEDLMAEKPHCSLIVDKHPNNVYAIEEILQFIQKPIFLHSVRDGRDVVASSLTTSTNHGFGATDFEQGILKWNKSVNAFEREKHRLNHLEVKYEEIFLTQKDFVKEVLTKCGLDSRDQIVDEIIDKNQWQNTKYSFANSDIKSRSETNSYYKNYFSNYHLWLMNLHSNISLERYNYQIDKFNIVKNILFRIRYFFKRVFRVIKRKFKK